MHSAKNCAALDVDSAVTSCKNATVFLSGYYQPGPDDEQDSDDEDEDEDGNFLHEST